jgi:hypothetical protein
MKLVALAFVSVVPTVVVAQPTETRINGAAAAEMYEKLNIQETDVRDEHGGQPFAKAKYGQHLGCMKYDDNTTSCWVVSDK